MRRLFKFRYPKLFGLLIAAVAAYLIFSRPDVSGFVSSLEGMKYVGIFIAGLFFSFGFTTPFAIGFFVVAEPSNLVLAAILGGLGATLSDFLIFGTIKLSFMDEFHRLERTRPVRAIEHEFHKDFSKTLRKCLIYVFAGFIIASPLPDELGVALLAGFSRIHPGMFIIISYLCNTLGILVMLLL